GENYPDRSAAAFTGLYRQSVSEQFYPYIRPQENGTRTGLRWWELLDHTGSGIRVDSDSLFSASALHYSIESLDSGPAKRNLHSHDLKEENFTQCCIDLRQMGLGCVNTWGALPRPVYMLPYGNYAFTFTISETKNNY
ncbi:MAG TPA: beta-galactosidase, partial [Bacteroidales bacterium]|nr:beta-galactosidase [Bacteroidales bacterium]HPL84973.1 beta-galactosidase [Bacteroidales bacterium]